MPNPSFEVYDTCPDNPNLISRATPWIPLSRTPDYFHRCAPPYITGVPNNYMGFKETKSNIGDGYAEIFVSFNNGREIIGCPLSDTLTIGAHYFISLDISPILSNIVKCFYNKIGVKLFTEVLSYSTGINAELINNYSNVYSDQMIVDTANWTKLKFSFIADSA